MASGTAKSVDEMTLMQLFEMIKILDVSDDGLVSVSSMRSLLRDALNQAEKTTNLVSRKGTLLENNRVLTGIQ